MLVLFVELGVANAHDVETTESKSLTIAVSSNFLPTMQSLATEFEKKTGVTLKLSSGFSGKHYAQIKNGAPYDLFFSADEKRPLLLEQGKVAVVGSRFTYAIGRLALLGYDTNLVEQQLDVFTNPGLQRLAIANPRLAPYGVAAQQVLIAMDVVEPLKKKIVRGENVNQAFQFVVSGNAELGLVSYAQIIHSQQENYWLIPSNLHEEIAQQAVIIKDSKTAREFADFMRSELALSIINEHGYDIP